MILAHELWKVFATTAGASVLLIAPSASSQPNSSGGLGASLPDPAHWTLTNLVDRIAAADRVVVTNWATTDVPDSGFSMSISGDRVGRVVKAVSAARLYRGQEHPNWEYDGELRFYHATNYLAAIYFSGGDFLANGVCHDDTGVLAEVHGDFGKREYYARHYKHEDEAFAAWTKTKAEARQWLKSSLHSVAGGNKKKAIQLVNDFYASGAAKILVCLIDKQAYGKGQPTETARWMIIALPQDPAARRRVFSRAREVPRDWIDDDVGQKYFWYEFW